MDARIFEWFAKNWWVVIFYVGLMLSIKLVIIHSWISHREKQAKKDEQDQS